MNKKIKKVKLWRITILPDAIVTLRARFGNEDSPPYEKILLARYHRAVAEEQVLYEQLSIPIRNQITTTEKEMGSLSAKVESGSTEDASDAAKINAERARAQAHVCAKKVMDGKGSLEAINSMFEKRRALLQAYMNQKQQAFKRGVERRERGK